MKQILSRIIRKHPLVYFIIYHTRFILSPKRRIGLAVRIPAHRRHIRRSTVIAGPRFLGFAGGLYNPGSVLLENGDVLLLAKGQTCHWWDAVGSQAHLAHTGFPVAITLDSDLKVKAQGVVKGLNNFPIDEHALEDFRLFRHKGDILAIHGLLPIVRQPCKTLYKEAKQTLSNFDPVRNRLTFQDHPTLDFATNPIEKNWVFLDRCGELYLLYSFHPYRVLKLTDWNHLSFTTVINQPQDEHLANIGGFGTMVSFSTNPIEYDANHWLLVVHQIEQSRWVDRCYHQWGILLDKNSLLPRKFSTKPLFESLGARGRMAGILYVTSVVKKNDDFIFFCGEGDAYITRIALSKSELEKNWVDLPELK